MSVPVALTIAGSDSSAGAGIQADLKTFAALGVYGASVITALTAQNSKGVLALDDVPAEFIAAQIEAVFSDLDIASVKIGIVPTAEAIEAVAAGLDRYRPRHVVFDPVMVATAGERLLRGDALAALPSLIKRAHVLTPNLSEAAALLDAPQARDEAEMRAQAEKLLALGAGAVLIKGGHAGGAESVDLLVDKQSCVRLAAPRVPTKNTHGSGCTFAAAIAAGFAKGFPLEQSAREAKAYVSAAIAAADRLGVAASNGPLHHFYKWW